ncbi:MAG: glucose-6-phosphate isomerase [Armatimonadota bacterium]
MRSTVPLSLEYSYLQPEVTLEEVVRWQPHVDTAHRQLVEQSGAGNDFLGWLEPSAIMPAAQLAEIQQVAARLRDETDVMVVVGIGGSYLGARAVIEALAGDGIARVLYAGQTLSADYTRALLNALKEKRFCINVVSKSGTTTEPAIAFRLLRELLERQVGKARAKDLIVATTDPAKGALRGLAVKEGYQTFPIPSDVGGRYSVFTAVGLLPIAYAGVDAGALLDGAVACAAACATTDVRKNPAYFYAVARNLLYQKGKGIEILASFEPRLRYLNEWWKQLYGESEGKELKGIFPASVEFTTDLHSMGQWIQEGRREVFESFINIAGGLPEVTIPWDEENADELNFLAGQSLDAVNKQAFQGTALAHRDGGVPSLTFTLPDLSARSLGALLYCFERACGISGYLLGVNPFNQPGVEAYKKNMFALLNKPGFKDESARVMAAVQERQGKNLVEF